MKNWHEALFREHLRLRNGVKGLIMFARTIEAVSRCLLGYTGGPIA